MTDDSATPPPRFVWVFQGENMRMPGGIFSSREAAEVWIRHHQLSGLLTAYPLDRGVYEWATALGYFSPKPGRELSGAAVGGFTSASQEHYHYAHGEVE